MSVATVACPDTTLEDPTGFAVDGSGNAYIVDLIAAAVYEVFADGGVTTLANSGFVTPWAVAVSNNGSAVYVSDQINAVVARLDEADGGHTVVAGIPGMDGFANGSPGQLYQPLGLAIAPDGGLWIGDYQNHLLRGWTPEGGLSTLAGRPGDAGCTDGLETATLTQPVYLSNDAADHIVFYDDDCDAIRESDFSGEVETLAADVDAGTAIPGVCIAPLAPLTALAADTHGNIFFANGTSRVAFLDSSGGVGSLADAVGSGIQGLALGPNGDLYALSQGDPGDTTSYCIYRIHFNDAGS